MVVFKKKWLFSGKLVVFGQSGCIRSISGKSAVCRKGGCCRQKFLY